MCLEEEEELLQELTVFCITDDNFFILKYTLMLEGEGDAKIWTSSKNKKSR